MPKIFFTKTKSSFRDTLSKMREEILPEKIRGDDLALWIMNFDELNRERKEGRYNNNYPQKEIIARWALETAIGISIQRQLPFYFAALFHIGRQWYVSEKTIASIESASTSENIFASVELTKNNLLERKTPGAFTILEAPTESLTEVFRGILGRGLEYHQAQLHQAHAWWDEWREEVGQLKKAVDNYRESSFERIRDYVWSVASSVIISSYQTSPLRSSMTTAGIEFKGEAAQTVSTGYRTDSDPMLPMLIAALGSRADIFHPELDRWFHYWIDTWRHAPEVHIALERLNKKYGTENPFDDYRPLRKAASQELRALIQEHELPNRRPSPWLHTWLNSLEEDPQWMTPIPYRSFENPEVLQSFLRSADSTIKRGLEGPIRPGETWQGFIQRLFEYEWVSSIVRHIAETNKQSQPETSSWSFESFVELITKVIQGLRGIGYELTFIKEERCLVVWKKAHEDGRTNNEDW
jgi:hypothetical protein